MVHWFSRVLPSMAYSYSRLFWALTDFYYSSYLSCTICYLPFVEHACKLCILQMFSKIWCWLVEPYVACPLFSISLLTWIYVLLFIALSNVCGCRKQFNEDGTFCRWKILFQGESWYFAYIKRGFDCRPLLLLLYWRTIPTTTSKDHSIVKRHNPRK